MSQAEFERLCKRVVDLEAELETTRKIGESMATQTPHPKSEEEFRYHLRHLLGNYAVALSLKDPTENFDLVLSVTGLDSSCSFGASVIGTTEDPKTDETDAC